MHRKQVGFRRRRKCNRGCERSKHSFFRSCQLSFSLLQNNPGRTRTISTLRPFRLSEGACLRDGATVASD
jgi:hypothetical protein